MFSHFLGIQEFLNTPRLLSALTTWVESQPVSMLFELTTLPDSPHARVLVTEATAPPGKATYQDSLARMRAVAALSEEDKATYEWDRLACRETMMSRLIADLKDSDGAYAKETAEKAGRIRVALLAEFGG